MTNEHVETTDASVVDKIETMLKNLFSSMQSQANPLPYAGENELLYGDPENRQFPLANAFGDYSRSHFAVAVQEIEKLELDSDKQMQLGTHLFTQYVRAELDDEKLLKRILDIINSQKDASSNENTDISIQIGNDNDGSYLSQESVIYEFPLAVQFSSTTPSEDGLIWRTILRTGRWNVSPSKKTPWNQGEALIVTPERLQELKASFDDGAFEYVTVPDTHNETSLNNRGFIKSMQITDDPERPGHYKLKAGFDITSKEAKKSIEEGSLAGVSCGILFDHVRKADGKKYTAAIHHVALTNQPWIDGLGGWEKLAASQYNISNVIVGTEENEHMTSQETQTVEELQAELEAMRRENASLMMSTKKGEVKDLLDKYQKEKNLTPAMLTAIEPVLLSAKMNETKILTLSDSGSSEEVDLESAITAMLDAMPKGNDLTSVEDTDGNEIIPDHSKPKDSDTKVNMSAAERAEAIRNQLGLSLATGDGSNA